MTDHGKYSDPGEQCEMDAMFAQVQRENCVPLFWHSKAKQEMLRRSIGFLVYISIWACAFMAVFYGLRVVFR